MSVENKFKNSLNLPKTDFPIAYNKSRDEEILRIWAGKDLYNKVYKAKLERSNKAKRFVLPWGPPYSNGPLHMGHAINGILKDFVCKSKSKQGYGVHFKCGWDCHGMPIEIKVANELNFDKENIETDPVFFKNKCREYAKKWIAVQKEGFKSLGILADYDNGYATMNFDYEASILRCFGQFVGKGFITRRNKSVSWCMHCQTVLAAAEIEYKDRKDPSVYIKFELTKHAANEFESRINKTGLEKISFLVWTTTPWTLPLNKGLAIHPNATYALVKHHEEFLILGKDLVKTIESKLGSSLELVAEFSSAALTGLFAKHILNPGEEVPALFDEMVGLTEGTAIVHIAPGCGPEDYLFGIKNNLEVYSPITPDGRYTSDIKIKELEGVSITDALGKVLLMLTEKNALVFKESITHSYPHCWRCHKGLIFRATKQWFCDLAHNDLQKKALKAIEQVNFLPEWGKARFTSFIGNRTEWCISRQRCWGVPIVAMKCQKCEEAFTSETMINAVADRIEKVGIEFWDDVTAKELKMMEIFDESQKCSNCHASSWQKEKDILDVWFDSGVQHTAVLKNESEDLFPSSLMLEGSDQHRGWFQSSMLTSLALHDKPCSESILTHGFVIDEQREKMSKSKGNVISPEEIIKDYGTDVLRLWVASSDYEKDIAISRDKFKSFAESYRKIRNTCRFMLSNLYDVNVPALLEKKYLENYDWKQLSCLDRSILGQFRDLINKIDLAAKEYRFSVIIQEVNGFCTNNLSAEYLDMVKDRLYAEKENSALRHNTQIMFVLMLDYLIHRLSPFLSFLAEDVYSHFAKDDKSIFEVHQPEIDFLDQIISAWDVRAHYNEVDKSFELLHQVRKATLKSIEQLREKNVLKQGIEAKAYLRINNDSKEHKLISQIFKIASFHEGTENFLMAWLGVSQVELTEKETPGEQIFYPWLSVKTEKASGERCQRCWLWKDNLPTSDLCNRCEKVMENKL